MDVGGAKGELKADINVTPLVDVMLVLLIIMLIVAPLLQKGVDVKLPVASNSAPKPETQEQTVVAVDKDRRFYLNGVPVRDDELATKASDILETKTEKVVLIRGDEEAPYASIMLAMDRLRQANIENIGLITERKVKPGERVSE
jgi:biopolymer transport protein ExbD